MEDARQEDLPPFIDWRKVNERSNTNTAQSSKHLHDSPLTFYEGQLFVFASDPKKSKRKSSISGLMGQRGGKEEEWLKYWCRITDKGLLFFDSAESTEEEFRIWADSSMIVRDELPALPATPAATSSSSSSSSSPRATPAASSSPSFPFLPPSALEADRFPFHVKAEGKVWILGSDSDQNRQSWVREICRLIRDMLLPLLLVRAVDEWSPQDVGLFLESVGIGQYREAMAEDGVTGKRLRTLTKGDLSKYGIVKLGHKLRLMKDLEDFVNMYKEEAEPVSGSLTSVDSNLSVGGLEQSLVVLCHYKNKVLRLRISEDAGYEELYAKVAKYYHFPFTIAFKEGGRMVVLKSSEHYYRAQFCMSDSILRLYIKQKKKKGEKEKTKEKEREREREKRKGRGKEGEKGTKKKTRKELEDTSDDSGQEEGSSTTPHATHNNTSDSEYYGEMHTVGSQGSGNSLSDLSFSFNSSSFNGLAAVMVPITAIAKSHCKGQSKCFTFSTGISFKEFKAKLKERHNLTETPWIMGRVPNSNSNNSHNNTTHNNSAKVTTKEYKRMPLFSDEQFMEWLTNGGTVTQTDSKAVCYEVWVETDLNNFAHNN